MQEKEIRERCIAGAVYSADQLRGLNKHEKPDFVGVVEPRREEKFGVEVTELYLSESAARLDNIPGYLSQIFAGRYRGGVDSKVLPVEEVTLKRHSGGEEKLKGLVQRLPDENSHLKLLAERIEEKSRKAQSYMALHHHNLIILDRSRRWRKTENAFFCKMLGHPEVAAATWRSPFREIFLVAELRGRWYFVPVVSRQLLAEFYGFLTVSCKAKHAWIGRQEDFLIEFGRHLERISAQPVMVRGEGAQLEVLHRRYGLLISEGKGVTLRDYLDVEYPVDSVQLPSDGPTDQVVLETTEFHTEFSFEIDLAVRAHEDPLRFSEEIRAPAMAGVDDGSHA